MGRPATGYVGRWAAALPVTHPATPPEDVLAGVAATLDVPWDGSGEPVEVAVPDAPGWLLLDAARAALLDRGSRRRLGAHHTPPALARRLTALVLDGLGPDVVVADPACGGGAFLVAAAALLEQRGADPAAVVHDQLVGLDLDPLAVATSRAALRCWAGSHGIDVDPAGIRVGDGLAAEWPADIVVGNPPFLSPLGAATSGSDAATLMRRQLAAPYVDVAGLFLLRSLEQVRPGGRVVLIQPESLLSSRDARFVRAAAAPHLEGLWIAGEPVFGAAVRVCSPVLRKGASAARVARWRGATVRPARSALTPAPGGGSWASLRPTTAPRVRVGAGPTVGDLATATAGFRDEFYGLAAAVADGGDGLPLVTSGLLDPGRSAWGERRARIAGRRYDKPTVDVAALDGRLRSWVDALRVPKVLVATQTKVVEAAPDPAGELIGLTPVVAVVPRDSADVWRIAAALTSPATSAWALHHFGGSALSADAIKLSARQVLAAPLPADGQAWAAAVDALRRGDVARCGAALAGADRRLLAWWRGRLPAATR